MYESPIEKIVGEIQSQIIKQDEENMMYEVKQAVGYSVDKNELIKALKYDREQYEKGYHDGLNVDKWIPVSERLPNNNVRVLCSAISTSISGGYTRFVGCCDNGDWFVQTDAETVSYPRQYEVTAWMPLPSVYCGE